MAKPKKKNKQVIAEVTVNNGFVGDHSIAVTLPWDARYDDEIKGPRAIEEDAITAAIEAGKLDVTYTIE